MSYTERSYTTTRREFVVPVDPAYGADHISISKAWNAAHRSYRDAHQLTADSSLPDNAIAFWPRDAEIVISYETEKPAVPSADDVAPVLAAYDRFAGRVSVPYARLGAAEHEKYRATAHTVLESLGHTQP